MPGAEDLVFSLCHEVGNLLGAIRLHADLIDADASPVELASASVEIDDSSARIRSWLALVRPLLGRERGEESGVSPQGLLQGVADAVEELGGRGVAVELTLPDGLARVRGRLETLHHLLATLAFHALEAAKPEGRVRLEAVALPAGGAELRVADDGAEDAGLEELDGETLTGRGLALATARVIGESLGGTAAASRSDGWTVVALRLPLLE